MLVALAGIALSAPALGASADRASQELETRIEALREEARYESALAAAETLATACRAAGDTVGEADANRLVATLRAAAALPANERGRLAEADRATAQIEEAFGRGEFTRASELAERQLAVRIQLLGGTHEEVAISLNDLAAIRRRTGDYVAAESLYTRALAIQAARLPEDHLRIAQTLNNQAMLRYSQSRYHEAEEGWRRTLDIRRRHLAPDDPAVARTIQNLAMALEQEGQLADVEPLLREALAIKAKTIGEKDPSYAATMGNLASVLDRMGEAGQAAVLYRKALATVHDLHGENHPDVAAARMQLGMHLEAQGDHEAAREMVTEALATQRRLLGADHPEVAITLNNLATILRGCGDEAEAEKLHREAHALLEARFGPDNPKTLKSLAALGRLKEQSRDYAEAESLLSVVLEASRRVYPPDHPELARAALNLSITLRKEGQYDRAAPLVEEAIAIRRRSLGRDHPFVASALRHEGHLWLLRGDLDRAGASLNEAAAIFETARLRVETGLARVTFLDTPYTLLAAVEVLRGRMEAAWPAVERDRGRALAELLLAADLRVLTPEERETERALSRELADREREFAALQDAPSRGSAGDAKAPSASGGREAGKGAPDLDSRREATRGQLLEAEARWVAFQRELAARHPIAEGQVLSLERVQATLSPNAAIVGWLDAPLVEDSTLSWGYVVRAGGPVRWARVSSLGSLEIDRPGWFLSLRDGLSDPKSSSDAVLRGAQRLWKERFAPLEEALAGVEELIVVPTGPTAGIPVESFVDGKGLYLADRFAISYAPSATVFAWLRERSGGVRAWKSALLLGDPPFTAADLQKMASDREPVANLSRVNESLLRGALDGDAKALGSLPRLPATRAEVAAIDSALGGATILLGASASEGEMARRAESGDLARYDVMHFATHALVDDRRPERSALVLSQVGLPDPLQAAIAGDRILDGLVSAKEVLGEWRLAADLVTLSACESGLGREVRGEGTVGFAHAFFQAGARSVLVSLWRVDDRATALLMKRFYEIRGSGEGAKGDRPPPSKAEALRQAKQWLRDYRTASGRRPYAHANFWSPFILIGDPS